MNINGVWLEDPLSGKPSVSLTMLVISFGACLVGGGLQIAGKIENTSICLELFYGCTALYFGRRVTAGGRTYDASSAPTSVNQVVQTIERNND